MPSYLRPPASGLHGLHGLRICFLAGTLGQGGAERQLFYNLKCLTEGGAHIDLLCLTQGEHWEKPLSNLGVTLHYVGGSGSKLGRLLQVLQLVRRLRPQIVQCQHSYTGIYGAVAGRLLGLPSIGAVRSDGFSELKSNGRFFGRLSLTWPRWVAANSARAIQNLVSLGYDPNKFLLLPNVIDTARFQPAAQPQSQDPFVILGVGSLERVKRFDRLLEIAVALRSKVERPVRVILAGDGTQRPSIEKLAEAARQKGVQVDLAGRVMDPLPLFQSAGALLLTSDYEGTPNVIMEAMACGLPVVATQVGGVAELIQHRETGFLFEPEDHASAVQALGRLAREPGLAQETGRRARAFIEQHHSTRSLPDLLSQLYQKVLASS